jgi:outer membrane protein
MPIKKRKSFKMLIKEYHKALIVLFLGVIHFNSNGQDSLSLERAIEIALKNNLGIRRSLLNESASKDNLRLARLSILPSINAYSGLNYSFGRNEDPFLSEFVNTKVTSSSSGISLSMPLFQSSLKFKKILENKLQLEAAESSTAKAKSELVLSIINSYLQILFNLEVEQLCQHQVNAVSKQVDKEKKELDAGKKSIVDLAQARSELASAKTRLNSAKKQLEISNLNLNNFLGLTQENNVFSLSVKLNIRDNAPLLSEKEIIERAQILNPTLKNLECETKIAEIALASVKAELLPKLNLQLGLSSGFSSLRQRAFLNSNGNIEYRTASLAFQIRDNFSQYAGVSLAIPIFNALSSQSAIRQARIRYQESKINQNIEKDAFRKIIKEAILNHRSAIEHLSLTEEQVEASKLAFDAVEKRYEVGLVNSMDLTQARSNLYVTETELIKAKYDALFKHKIIAFYTGEL